MQTRHRFRTVIKPDNPIKQQRDAAEELRTCQSSPMTMMMKE
jgi:hypothetical protein